MVQGRPAAASVPVRKRPAISEDVPAIGDLDFLEVCAYRGSVSHLACSGAAVREHSLLLFQLRLYRVNGHYVGFQLYESHIVKMEKILKKARNLDLANRLLGALNIFLRLTPAN